MASLLMNRLIPEDRNRAAERIREIRGKTMSGRGGYNVIIFKQKNRQYSKMLKKHLTGALIPYTRPDFDWALLNFRLTLKLDRP